MKKYVITFDDDIDMFVMDGKYEEFIGNHFYEIAKETGVTTSANSESHHLAILRANGVEIELVDIDW